MKRILLSICMTLALMTGWAQVEPKYGTGSVPVVNGRVMFQDTITTVLSKEEAFAKIEAWAKTRFNKPNVIISKFITNDKQNQQLSLTAEEYMVFADRFFVLDRTRINYWYEEERDGGSKFSAEETITDKQAFNKKGTKLLKEQGKFRRKTIDFFEQCVIQISHILS